MPKISQIVGAPSAISGAETVVLNQNGETFTTSLSSVKAYTNTDVEAAIAAAELTAAELTAAQIMSKAGDQLIASLRAVRGTNAGTAYFATTKSTSGAFQVKTTTGYARLVNPDNTLGAQVGTGTPAANITLTIPASGLHRAYGVIAVASGGSVRSGDITHLDLSGNALTSFDGTGLSSLTSIILADNQLTSFSGTGLSSLTELRLYNNALTSFDGTGLSSLTFLILSSNRLTSFDGTGLSSLTYLDLSSNQLTSFSGAGLSSLTLLDLSSNQLTSFSGAGLSSLTLLYLYGNALTSFSGTGLSSLTTLYLNDNQLATFDITGLTSLSELVLNNNQLTSIDAQGLVLSYGLSHFLFGVFGSNISDNLLDGSALDAFYTSLGVDAGETGIILVSGNPGTDSDDPTIATAKGYTVIGT